MLWLLFQGNELSYIYVFSLSGHNGVMVQTKKAVYGNDNTSIVVQFNDKNTFYLQAQSQQFRLNAILCQKGNLLNVLILIRLFCSNYYYYINVHCYFPLLCPPWCL